MPGIGMTDLRTENLGIGFSAYMYPIPSMYGIFTYIYHENQPNVGKYTIHGWYGLHQFLDVYP